LEVFAKSVKKKNASRHVLQSLVAEFFFKSFKLRFRRDLYLQNLLALLIIFNSILIKLNLNLLLSYLS